MDIVIFILVAIISFFLGWFIAKTKFSAEKGVPREEADKLNQQIVDLKITNSVSEEKSSNLQNELNSLNEKYSGRERELIEITSERAKLAQEVSNLKQRLDEQKEEITGLQKKFTLEFENLANRIFEEKSLKFTEQNRENLKTILNPLGEKIKEFEKKVEDTYGSEARQRASLGGEIKKLIEQTQSVGKVASNLATALKGEAKTQGNWGEMILERILEYVGLTKDREYLIQKSFIKEGRRVQPDVVVKLPGNRDIVIDSKVSLVAYERFCSADTEEKQNLSLKEHISSVKKHIDELSAKNYQNIYDINSSEFVMMFIPVEPAYLAAMKGDPNIWNYAYDKEVLFVSPTNLIAILKMIENLWRQEAQRKNVQEIARQGGELYDKFVAFVEDLQNIGKKLNDAEKSYESAMNKLSDGKGNLVSRAEKLKELGAKAKKSIPSEMLVDNTN